MMPPGSLEQVVFRMDALHRVAAAGVPVLNPPRAVEAAVDKYLTLSLLEQAGLPVPRPGPASRRPRRSRPSRSSGATSWSSRSSDPRDAAWCESATRSWPGGRFTRSNGWARFSTSSASSGIPATIFASSCCGARSWE